jgi:hypothetical protein
MNNDLSKKIEDFTSKLDGIAKSLSETNVAKKYSIDAVTIKKSILIGVPLVALILIYTMYNSNSVSCQSSGARAIIADIAKEHNMMVGLIQYSGKGEDKPVGETCEENSECKAAQSNFDKAQAAALTLTRGCLAIPVAAGQYENNDKCPQIIQDGQSVSFMGNWGVLPAEQWGTTIPQYDDTGMTAKDAAGNALPDQDSARKIFMRQNAGEIITKFSTAEISLSKAKDAIRSSNAEKYNNAWKSALEGISYKLNDIIMTEKDKDTGSVACKAKLSAEVPGWGGASQPIAYTVEKTTGGELYATMY